jgi:hypothetical protein
VIRAASQTGKLSAATTSARPLTVISALAPTCMCTMTAVKAPDVLSALGYDVQARQLAN